MRMRRRHHERGADELERRRSDAIERPSEAAEAMLALQRSAGNRAVSTLVARAPAGDKKEGEKAEGARATLADIGTIQLLSVSFPVSGPGGSEREQPSPPELVLSSRVGEHTPKLAKAASDGKPMDVEIVMPGKSVVRLKLTGAIVSSYQVTGHGQPDEIETWTLNSQAIEHTTEEAKGEKP